MTQDSSPAQIALSKLSKPGEAAQRFGKLLSQQSWAVLGLSINDFQPLVEHYGQDWQEDILGFVAEQMFGVRETKGTAEDLLVRLTNDTFLIITQATHVTTLAEEIQQRFNQSVSTKFPQEDLCGGIICLPLRQQYLPLPSLAIGIVTPTSGPFSNPRELLDKVLEARSQNERPALSFSFSSLIFTLGCLQEESQVAKYNPSLLPLIERFAHITTGPIHDLRNGLSLLYDEARNLADRLASEKQRQGLLSAARHSRFLLETGSEIRFRGGANSVKTNLSELLQRNHPLWVQKIDRAIQVDIPTPSVEVFVDPAQVEQALYNLLRWLKNKIVNSEGFLVTCHSNQDEGQIIISGNLDPFLISEKLASQALIEQGLDTLQKENTPWLYVAQKLVIRSGGKIKVQPGKIILSFPFYHWQDIQSTDILAEQIQHLRLEVEQLKAQLSAIRSIQTAKAEDYSLKEIMSLGTQVITELEAEFDWLRHLAKEQLGEGDHVQRSSWTSIEAGSHFCQLLTVNLMSLERGHLSSLQPIDVPKVLNSIRQMLHSKIENVAELEWDVDSQLPPVTATEMALAQVVLNLTLNALEELAQVRSTTSKLRIAAYQRDNQVHIEIADTGRGLPAEVIEQLFKSPINTRQLVEGGIGLKVVKSILDDLKGDIEFRPWVDEGTLVSLTLPIWND